MGMRTVRRKGKKKYEASETREIKGKICEGERRMGRMKLND